MSRSAPKYMTEGNVRAKRMHNIACALLELKQLHPDKRAVGSERLRVFIRETKLKLKPLQGEARLGDLRAHGDAVGGHGLKLVTEEVREKKVVLLDETNLAACKTFLNNEQNDILW